MGARFYSPLLGRFLSADSIVPQPGGPQSLNRYTYASNSPLTRVDLNGHADTCSSFLYNCGGLAPLPKWDDPKDTVSEAHRRRAEMAYQHLQEDPAYFANLYINPGTEQNGWGTNPEAISLMQFAQYTELHTTPEDLMMQAFADKYGANAASQLYDVRWENTRRLAAEQSAITLHFVGSNGYAIAAAFISMDEAIELAIRFVGGDAKWSQQGRVPTSSLSETL